MPDVIGDDEILTHYGVAGQPWKNTPPIADGYYELSVIRRDRDAAFAASVVLAGGLPRPDGKDRVRWCLAGTLRTKGFEVQHTPTRRNPDHCSVSHRDEWTPAVAGDFDSCFTEVRGMWP